MRGVARALFFFFNDTATTEIYTLSLHDALPIYIQIRARIRVQTLTGHQFRGLQQRAFVVGLELEELLVDRRRFDELPFFAKGIRSEEHTSELQSQSNLVCRLLLEKKKKRTNISIRDAHIL